MKLASFSLSLLTVLGFAVSTRQVEVEAKEIVNEHTQVHYQELVSMATKQNGEQTSSLIGDFSNLVEHKEGTGTKVVSETSANEPSLVIYEVTSGDNLSMIATAFEISMEDLLKENPEITNPSLIFAGEKINMTTKVTLDEGKEKLKDGQDLGTSAATPTTSTEVANTNTTSATTSSTGGQTLTMESTAYSYQQAGLSNFTALGIDLSQNPMVIAVDPNVIPLGTKVYVEGYGEAIAGDTGGAIKGNIIDVHFSSVDACYQWGRRSVTVTILS